VEAGNPATVRAAVKLAMDAARSVPADVPRVPQGQGGNGGAAKAPPHYVNQPAVIASGAKTPPYEGGKPKVSLDKISCYSCKQNGHYANSKECPLFGQRKRGQLSSSSTSQTKRIGLDACPRVSMRFHKVLDLMVLLDSGSGPNVVSFEKADELIAAGCEWISLEQRFEGVAKAQMLSRRQLKVLVRIEEGLDQPVEFLAKFVDGDCGEDAILGYPTMKELDLFYLLRGKSQEGGATEVARIEADPDDHVVEYDDKFIEDLAMRSKIDAVLSRYLDVFNPIDSQGADVPPFEIVLKEGAELKVMLPRRMSPNMAAIAKQQNDEELALGHVRPSSSSVASPEVMAPKKRGEWRRCIDFIQVNKGTVDMGYPIQHMYTMLSRCNNKVVYAKLDLTVAYKQIRMAEGSRYLTAFATP
jgi:hypothetical protein